MLTLSDAQKTGKLQDFVAEQEAAGIGPIDLAEFDALAAKTIKAPQLEDQTSRSASGDGSTGKRTGYFLNREAGSPHWRIMDFSVPGLISSLHKCGVRST